jgi:hypothetical protein
MESVARYFTSPAGGVTGGNRPAPPPSRSSRSLCELVGLFSLTYPPDPKVDQAGKIFVLGSFPFVFLSEIRRNDSRAEICEQPMRTREVEPRSRKTAARLAPSHTHRTRRSTRLAKFSYLGAFRSFFLAKSEGTTHEQKSASSQ